MKRSLFFLTLFLVACTFSSCVYQTARQKSFSSRDISLFLEMPENKVVFENMSSLVYDCLWRHFDRVGYRLVDQSTASHSLHVTIKDVDSSYKFLSPDLLTYAVKMKIVLLCRLYDASEGHRPASGRKPALKKIIARKEFTLSTLIPKAKEYVANSKFSEFEYRRLLEQQAYRIDQYFRPFLQTSEL